MTFSFHQNCLLGVALAANIAAGIGRGSFAAHAQSAAEVPSGAVAAETTDRSVKPNAETKTKSSREQANEKKTAAAPLAGSLAAPVPATGVAELPPIATNGAAGAPPAGASTHPGPWTLEEALTRAFEVNPDVRRARAVLEQNQATLGRSYSAFVPNVAGTASANHLKNASVNAATDPFVGEPHNQYTVGLRATQPLFRRGLWSAYRAAQQNRDIARVGVEIAENVVRKNVYQAFYSILLAQRRFEILTRLEALTRNSLGVIQRKFRIGTARELDVLQEQTQLALQRPLIEQEQSNVRVAASRLAHIIDRNEDVTISVRGSMAVPETYLTNPPTGAETQRPEIRRIQLREEQFDNTRVVTLAENWPTLDALGSWQRITNARSDLFDQGYTSWSVGVQLNVPIFSGLSSLAQRRELAAQKSQLDMERKAVLDQLSLEMVTVRQNLELKRLQIESNERAQSLAQQAYSYANRTYALGTTPFTQFSEVRANLLQSQLNLEQARYEALIALLDYYVATNHPVDEVIRRLSGVKPPTES